MEWASVASVLRPWPLENKRFYLVPDARGSGVAATLLQARVEYARGSGVQHPLRLETGDQQHAAIRFYRKHGFSDDGVREHLPETGTPEARMSRGAVAR